jgi:hypothetical protein
MYTKIDKVQNFEQLKIEVLNLISKMDQDWQQIMCQSRFENQEDFKEGVGKIEDLDIKEEKMYQFIQPSLKGSYLEQIISEYKGFRTRIMKLTPKKCYTLHKDPTPRIHIPIQTNDRCWMVWPFHQTCLQPKIGEIYWTDTRKPHTFFNGDETLERIHIVMVVE